MSEEKDKKEPDLTPQNLVEATPMWPYVQQVIGAVTARTNASVVDREHVVVNINVGECTKLYEKWHIDEIKKGGVETPAFLSKPFKAYLDKTMVTNVKVTPPIDRTPNRLLIHMHDGAPLTSFNSYVCVGKTLLPPIDKKAGYLVVTVTPVVPHTKENWINYIFNTVSRHRDLQQGKALAGGYIIAIHGFYAKEYEFQAELKKAVNFTLNAPLDSYDTHSTNIGLDKVVSFAGKSADDLAEMIVENKGVNFTPTTETNIFDTSKVSEEAMAEMVITHNHVREKLAYAPLEVQASKSPNTPITTLYVTR